MFRPLLALALLTGCATVSERVVTPARSVRGRSGFGVMSAVQSQLGGSTGATRTAVAGVSAPDVEAGGGDWVWRVSRAGMTLELCHAAWAERPCRTALFDGGPNTLMPFSKFSVLPTLVDPVNLGRVQIVTSDARGNVWVFGSLERELDEFTVPTAPGYGVWAMALAGLHHCELEGERPQCRAAVAPNGKPLNGRLLSIKTYRDGDEVREGAWINGNGVDSFGGNAVAAMLAGMQTKAQLTHCEVHSGAASPPRCEPAQLDPELAADAGNGIGPVALASHSFDEEGKPRHVVWLQTVSGVLARCEAGGGAAAACRVARTEP